METLDLPPASELSPPPGPPTTEPTATARAGESRGDFDGLTWTHRNGFDVVLTRTPAERWSSPDRQGWTLIKRNATRDVWQAEIDGEPYYVKYYFRKEWTDSLKHLFRQPACRAEWNGGIFALRAGIPAVRPVGFSAALRRDGRSCALLVTKAVERALPLNEFWRILEADHDPRRRRADVEQLTELLAELIARAHQAGFEHLDMHAANILVQPLAPRRYRVLLVDLHSARLGVPLSHRAVVRNLAQLNQWFRRHSGVADRLRFLRAYLRWRDEFEHAFEHGRALGLSFTELVAALARTAERHATRLWAQRDRRLQRDGKYFSQLRIPGAWRGMAYVRCKPQHAESPAEALVCEPDWWRKQLDDPLRWFERDGARIYKDSHSALVSRTALQHDQARIAAVIKRPRARNFERKLRHLLPPSRSRRCWLTGNALLHRDVATARPLAYLERRLGPLVLDSVALTEAVPAAIDLEAHLRRGMRELSSQRWFRHKRELATLLARHLRHLSERGFAHRDCKAQNLLVLTEPRLKLLWIDMDGVRRARRVRRRATVRALTRMLVSLRETPGLGRGDWGRFLKTYTARFGSDPREWRALWAEVAAGAARKTRALQARRAWKRKRYGRE